jgi:hypothetical protein
MPGYYPFIIFYPNLLPLCTQLNSTFYSLRDFAPSSSYNTSHHLSSDDDAWSSLWSRQLNEFTYELSISILISISITWVTRLQITLRPWETKHKVIFLRVLLHYTICECCKIATKYSEVLDSSYSVRAYRMFFHTVRPQIANGKWTRCLKISIYWMLCGEEIEGNLWTGVWWNRERFHSTGR